LAVFSIDWLRSGFAEALVFALRPLLLIQPWWDISFNLPGAARCFEYLMRRLIMPSYPDTLLDHSCKAAVSRQISQYGRQRSGGQWAISDMFNITGT